MDANTLDQSPTLGRLTAAQVSPAFDPLADEQGQSLLEYTTSDDGIHFKPADMRRLAA